MAAAAQDSLSPDGRPALHAAADLLAEGESGASKVCQIFETLLKGGADPNSRAGPLEETALQAVLRQGEAEARLEVAKVLLDHGADPNAADNCGESPLFEAACNGDEAAAELLRSYGAKLATDADAEEAAPAQDRQLPAAESKDSQKVVLNMKYVTAQGKEWTLKKLASHGSKGSDDSTNGDDPTSSAALSSDDDSDYRGGSSAKAVATKNITSYLVSSEEALVSVYLKLESLFEGASEIFADEGAFKMQVSPDHLVVRVHGPGSQTGSEAVCWELSVPLPAAVDAESASLKLRKGKLTVKLPKAAGAPQRLSAAEEARAVARSEVPEAAAAKQPKAAKAPAKKPAEQKVARDAEDAVRAYGQSMEAALQEEEAEGGTLFRRKAFPWRSPADVAAAMPGVQLRRQELRAEIERDLRAGGRGGAGGDLAGEQIHLCSHCRLPVGDMAYVAEGKEPSYLHGECIAQLRLLDLQKEDKARLKSTAELKKKRRAKYDIGWKVDSIPRPMTAATKLDLGFVPRGMCCLVYDEESHSVGVLPTLDPMGSVNLEYLSLALQVRIMDGREPSFSLDLPAEAPGTPDSWMQKKRFEPEWLAGTSAGEVMFQADYHLKELSMGEYEQPVLGMRSCFDYSEVEQGSEWKAREWFVVREAEVNFTDSNVVVPSVRMGVQAREQIKGESGLEDVPITRPDHPLVKYAEAFTHNFDLIAERKSVIYHLRELAKATVLAKFIVDAELFLDESWLSLAEQSKDPGFKEIPQLWNERAYSQIRVQDGALVHQEKGDGRGSMYGVYGGVEFGVERFQLSRPGRIAPPTASGMVVHKPTAVSFGLERFRIARPKRAVSVSAPAAVSIPAVVSAAVSAPPSAVVESRPPREFVPTHEVPVVRSSRPPRSAVSAVSRVAVSRPSAVRAVEPAAAQPLTAIVQSRLVQRASLVQRPGLFQRPSLQGVDLGLDQFNLSEAGHVEGKGGWDLGTEGLDACVSIGGAFWEGLKGSSASAFKDEDRALLKDIFNPHLSDRREEGEAFVPPDRRPDCLLALRELLAEEAAVRQQRTEHFLSKDFLVDEPGPLFPASWRNTMSISRQSASEKARETLLARPDYKAEASMFDEVLKSAAPTFDRTAEDGIRFRIYRVGSLEVRTTQQSDAKETVGAVYSVRATPQGAQRAEAHEQLVKATQYVERAGSEQCRYYVVLETERGHLILTEKLGDGKTAWEENPRDLEDRNSLAKVLRSADCRGAGVSVGDVQGFGSGGAARGISSKRYADGAFAQAAGENN